MGNRAHRRGQHTHTLGQNYPQSGSIGSTERGHLRGRQDGIYPFLPNARTARPAPPLRFTGTLVYPQNRVKILGVTLDQKLRMDGHIEKVTTAATAKCLALAGLQGVRPKQIRQLYRSVVVPTMDYVASAWYSKDRRGTESHANKLRRVQRLGARIILRSFRQVGSARKSIYTQKSKS